MEIACKGKDKYVEAVYTKKELPKMRVLHLLNHATGMSEVLEQKRSRFMKCSETRTLQAVKTMVVHYTFYLKACSTIISQLDSLAITKNACLSAHCCSGFSI